MGYRLTKAIESKYLDQEPFENLQTLFSFSWLIGGLFNDLYFYSISLFASFVLAFVATIRQLFGISETGIGIKSQLFVGLLSHMLYFQWGKKGEPFFTLFGLSFDLEQASSFVLLGFLVYWRINKRLDFDNWWTELKLPDLLMLFTIGLLDGWKLIILGLLIMKVTVPTFILSMTMVFLVVEPFIVYLFHQQNVRIGSLDMQMTEFKLPIRAVTGVLLYNTIIVVVITIVLEQVTEEWQLLRAMYLMGFFIAFIFSRSEAAKFHDNPLSFTSVGKLLDQTPDALSSITGHLQGAQLTELVTLRINDGLNLKLEPNTVIVPLKRYKDRVEVAIIGQLDVFKKLDDYQSKLDGITSAILPVDSLKELQKYGKMDHLANLDLSVWGLDLDTLQGKFSELASLTSNWLTSIKKELTKFRPESFTIVENDEYTQVDLGLVQVFETKESLGLPKLTRVKIPGIKVIETEKVTSVRLLGSTIVDHKEFTFVDFPGLSVLDTKAGTMVKIFGLKIGDTLPLDTFDKVKRMIHQSLREWENQIDRQIGKAFSQDDSLPLINLSSNGRFLPMIESEKGGYALELPSPDKNPTLPQQPEESEKTEYEIIKSDEE